MKVRRAMRALGLAAALTGGQIGAAQAAPPIIATHEVVCIVHAIPPFKAGNAANAPIGFGYQVHCTGTPDGRDIEYVLNRNGARVAFGRSQSTTPDTKELFYYECSTAGPIYKFSTYVAMLGRHMNVDFSEDTSGDVALRC